MFSHANLESNLNRWSQSQFRYQRYYQMALRSAFQGASVKNIPGGSVFERGYTLLTHPAGRMIRHASKKTPLTASYCLVTQDRKYVFAIDPTDSASIEQLDVCEEVDIYFKANRWGCREYPENIRPIVNGNGMLNERRINFLRSLRGQTKMHNVVFISRVWGGIEHNVRCFEALKRIPGDNLLLAIFTQSRSTSSIAYLKEKASAREYLEKIGIRCIEHQINPSKLWHALARSRVVFLRAGKHLCIPWRLLDLLAMGSVTVMDSTPYPTWPQALFPGKHFLSCGIPRQGTTDPGPPEAYENVAEVIRSALGDDKTRNNVAYSAAEYFDQNACPEAVGRYIAGELMSSV